VLVGRCGSFLGRLFHDCGASVSVKIPIGS
jgi:hypothetical protein